MLRLKNTLSGRLEEFRPRDPERVTLYSCGPTVYSYAHIGNFRSFLGADVLRRVLLRRGYRVRQVMNITDVGHMTEDHLADATGEDKLSKAARELGSDPYRVAERFERAFVEDAKALRLSNYAELEADDRTLHPQATRHIPEMLAMIQRLLERGFAYLDADGQVYFEVSKFPEYGALSGKVIEELELGARVAVRSEKRDPRDFALWKVDDKHLMKWDPHSPAGWRNDDFDRLRRLVPNGVDARMRPGFPGWHIECSAMSKAHLGAEIDLHTGGEDNVFPHHECEIAQSFGASDELERAPKAFARYWLHVRFLLVDNRKMSKRDGTFFTVRDLMDPKGAGRSELAPKLAEVGFEAGCVPPNVLRYALLSNHYGQPMNFAFDLLAQAKASVERIQSLYDRAREFADGSRASGEVETITQQALADFDRALDDDLNLPNALAALFGLIAKLNTRELSPGDATLAKSALESIDGVLDVLDRRVRSGLLRREELEARAREELGDYARLLARTDTDQQLIEALILHRQRARSAKDFAAADAIRDELKRRGVGLDDTPRGVRWRID